MHAINLTSIHRFILLRRIAEHATITLERGNGLNRFNTYKGFTLAEVLITLGIIGVVSAITIPSLIANYQSRTFATAASVFESKLAEALKVMNSQGSLAGYTSTERFVEELATHYKISRICRDGNILDCFPETVYWGNDGTTPTEVEVARLKTSKHFGQDEWDTEVIGIQFANGTNALVAYNPECVQDPYSNQVITLSGSSNSANVNTSCLAVLYDTNGHKAPNSGGSDLRGINIRKLIRGCFIKINGMCIDSTPTLATPHRWNACSAGRTNDPKDLALMSKYGINMCEQGDDYWAGAVMQCGGVNKLISEAQMLSLAEYLYGTDSIAPEGTTSGLIMDDEKRLSLGFTGNSFSLISNTEFNMAYSYYRNYSKYSTKRNFAGRKGSGYYVLCIGED